MFFIQEFCTLKAVMAFWYPGLQRFAQSALVSIAISSMPMPVAYGPLAHHTCGLWPDLQFGMYRGGEIPTVQGLPSVHVPPVMLVTVTICCCIRPLRSAAPGPPCAHAGAAPQTKTFPVSCARVVPSVS